MINDQVISLEIAKKLKELKVEQESYFHWKFYDNNPFIKSMWLITTVDKKKVLDPEEYISAFTAGEIIELLPTFINFGESPFDNYYLHIGKRTAENIKYIVGYYCDSYLIEPSDNFPGINPFSSKLLCKEYAETFQDALAKLLIHLIENKLIGILE